MKTEESYFRRGACHGAAWIESVVTTMLSEGAKTDDIIERLQLLDQVLLDWREGQVQFPALNPWDIKKADLDAYIAENQTRW